MVIIYIVAFNVLINNVLTIYCISTKYITYCLCLDLLYVFRKVCFIA